MKILITNDDGINAEGIKFLAMELEKEHEIIVIAPDTEKSACSHSITLKNTLYLKEAFIDGISSKCYSLNGTPVDCVKIGIEYIANDIDLVISGINFGSNLGTDVLYSGTVSAAIEAAIQKKPSIAISLRIQDNLNDRFKVAAQYAKDIVNRAILNNLKSDVVLNVNVPDIPKNEIKGIKVCNLGNKIYQGCYKIIKDENGNEGYSTCGYPKDDVTDNTDVYYIGEGFVTLTPLHYDLTNFNIINDVAKWV
ncbi:5'/3'-nucleotidase SurE [Clostridium cylindrosporum]|uniref:5'-nucleotidase SurE n=1 Tax=Clostridium cylindrosporum DSM 605 TaxID=1121307 RepID=A0A0J8DAQ2_CLOCY|nr:5'/3'-nucleotidase SurE [Clostridium cylindrosporum]KMT21383.1 5'-nucleotidase SurE [Clostridium cylindrosporum DSM 605]